MSGLNDRLFWFLFFKLDGPKTYPGLHAIPRFVPDDHAKLAEANKNVQVTQAVTFGDIYANRTHATVTALPHFSFKTWTYGRIMLVGDSAHKFNPISGEGGNSAVEDAAVLAGRLHQLLESKQPVLVDEKRTMPSKDEMSAMFGEVHAERSARVSDLVAGSHEAMRSTSWATKEIEIWDKLVLPHISSKFLQQQTSDPVSGGARCTALPVPAREHAVPFDDEKAAHKSETGVLKAMFGCWK